MPHATCYHRLPTTVYRLLAAAKVCAKELNEIYFNELGLGAEGAATAKTNAKRCAVHATWATTVASRQLPVGCTKTVSVSVGASCRSCCYAQEGNTLLTQSVCKVGNTKKKINKRCINICNILVYIKAAGKRKFLFLTQKGCIHFAK